MSRMPTDSDDTRRFEVRIYENGDLVATERFDGLEAAEAFADGWTERVLGAHADFEELSHTHDLYELVEQDTAQVEEYPRPSGE